MFYFVYEGSVTAYQLGSHYVTESDMQERFLDEFKTLEEAVDFANSYDLGEPSVLKSKRGLDSVGYGEVRVYENGVVNGETVYGDAVYVRSALTDAWREAMRKAELSYWDFLDYESDHYLTVSDYMQYVG